MNTYSQLSADGDEQARRTRLKQMRRRDRLVIATTATFGADLSTMILLVLYGPFWLARYSFEPLDGDIIFQSLPRTPLVKAIEGVSRFPYSHCGIVAWEEGDWIVYEAFHGIEKTPLDDFLVRGRNRGFAVYRAIPEFEMFIPAFLEHARTDLGLPYDSRYRMDDERIYCSELVFKAWRDATDGQSLGDLVRLKMLNWRPFESTIVHFENGAAPLDREMITPFELARASQLELVTAFKCPIATR